MAKQRTQTEDAIYLKARNLFEGAIRSNTYSKWSKQAQDDTAFYEGWGQWTSEERAALEARGQPAIVINKVAPKIDAMCGFELKNQTKISYKPTMIRKKDQADMADAFTYLAFHVQEKENVASKCSQVFKDGFVTGIGWLEVDTVCEGQVSVEICDPFEMVWDVDDATPDMSQQMYGARQKWVSLEDAKNMWPEWKSELESLVKTDTQRYPTQLPMTTITTGNPQNDYAATGLDGYVDGQRGRVRIIITYYREIDDVWYAKGENSRLYRTFSEKDAKQLGIEVEKKREMVNKFAVYTSDILLDYGISKVQGRYLPIIPFVYKRTRKDRVPYGLVYASRDAQTEYNKRRSKALHLLNTRQVVADMDAVEDFDVLLREVSRPDGVILKRTGKELDIRDNVQLGEAQFRIMEASSSEIQETMGVYDEVQGRQTNAVSGRAIAARTEGSVKTQSFAFDNLKLFKKRFGEVLLFAMQEAFNYEMKLDILQDDKLVKAVHLNFEQNDTDGKPSIVNDVRTINFKVAITEVPDYSARPEEIREYITQMVMNGQGQFLMSPVFNRLMGVSQPDELAASMQEIMKSLSPSPQQAGGAEPGAAGQAAGAPSLLMQAAPQQ